ncbi:MAG: hypothetical protein U0I76_11345 [Lachnospiraceae bacterium]|nr:hypothetical protein [Lachnospiraceae bacterium]
MSNRVYTYTKISELKNAPYFKEIAALPQLTMSREMAANIVYDMRILKGNVLGFSSFAQRLFPGWNTSAQKFAYMTALNQYLRDKIAVTDRKGERDWLFGCKKNLFAAIQNIIRLEEAKVHPEDVKASDRDISLFLELWKYLEQLDNSIVDFRNRMQELEEQEVFERDVNRIFHFHGNKAMVWNGFPFLTPIQQFVYDCFIRSGYSIYALIQDEKKYPYANEIWRHLYQEKNGYPAYEQWRRFEDPTAKNPLGEIFETGQETTAPNLKIIKYSNTVEFVEDISRIKEEGFYLYSADDYTANSMLKDYFPERYEVRNLLSYPIGQFIYTLHKMWDENLQCITLRADGLRKCFASGWLSAHGKSSMNYTDDLERILPYFENYYTVEEWKERLDHFSEVYENAYDMFKPSEEHPEGEERQQRRLANPFVHFGPFSIKEDRVGDVIDMIGQLIQMARTLFGKNEPVSIQQHMSKLDTLLYQKDGMPPELYREEREKVKQIFEVLENEKIRDFLCYPGDLAAALLSFMSGKMEEVENNNGLKTLVFNIFQIESASVSNMGKVHICLADITKLPGTADRYSWPVEEAFLQELAADKVGTYIPNWLENNRLTTLANRYYFYNALKNREIELSWIYQQGEKRFSPSPYITLLDKLSDAKIRDAAIRNLDLQYVSGVMAHKRFEKNYSLKESPQQHLYEDELAYSLCPIRYLYSCVLGDCPAYRNEYQQNRAIVRFIQILERLLKDRYSIEQVAEQVFELFPYIRKAEKRQMLDDAVRWELPDKERGYTVVGSYKYTEERLNLEFLDNESYSYAKKAAAMLMSRDGKTGIYPERRGTDGSRNCEFCPHIRYCSYAIFGIDYKGDSE